MNSLRVARSALRARPTAFRAPLQQRGYADVASDKIRLSLALPHQVCLDYQHGRREYFEVYWETLLTSPRCIGHLQEPGCVCTAATFLPNPRESDSPNEYAGMRRGVALIIL